jgi:hypothetical protein
MFESMQCDFVDKTKPILFLMIAVGLRKKVKEILSRGILVVEILVVEILHKGILVVEILHRGILVVEILVEEEKW